MASSQIYDFARQDKQNHICCSPWQAPAAAFGDQNRPPTRNKQIGIVSAAPKPPLRKGCAGVVRGLCGHFGTSGPILGPISCDSGTTRPSDPTPKAMQFNRIRCIFNDAGVTSPPPSPLPQPHHIQNHANALNELQRFSKILGPRYFQKHANP